MTLVKGQEAERVLVTLTLLGFREKGRGKLGSTERSLTCPGVVQSDMAATSYIRLLGT